MEKEKLKERIIEILCGRKNDEIGKKCKTMFDGSADQILALLEAEKKKWVEEILEKLPPESKLDTIFEKGRNNAIQETRQKLKS